MEDLLMNDYTPNRTITYVVLGKPVPLNRPRLGEHGVYDSQKLLKAKIGFVLKIQQNKAPTLCGMLHLHLDFYMPLPKTKSHRDHLIQQQYHVYKPDISNLIKFIEDVCVDIKMIEDDCLIASISARKLYSEQTRTEFYFETLKKESPYNE
jgi:Holliday junction resolvase RusA-like endonuclease